MNERIKELLELQDFINFNREVDIHVKLNIMLKVQSKLITFLIEREEERLVKP